MTSSSDEPEAIYRRLMSGVDGDHEDAVGELLHADFVDHNAMPGQSPGPAGFIEWMRSVRTVFPDLTATVEDVVVGTDRVAGRVRYRGTHGGPLAGVPATGRPVVVEAFHIARVQDGVIVEWWGTADLLGALQQIGARIEPPEER